MELEKEISQKKFSSEAHKLAVNLIFTYHWLSAYYDRHLNTFGITQQQYNVLRILRGRHPEPASIKLVRERMLDRMSDASRIVEKLRVKKLADRQVCADDRRACDVRITEEGLRLLSEIDKLDQEFNGLFSTLTEEEKKTANSLLDKLRG